jgi:hypothetical protein
MFCQLFWNNKNIFPHQKFDGYRLVLSWQGIGKCEDDPVSWKAVNLSLIPLCIIKLAEEKNTLNPFTVMHRETYVYNYEEKKISHLLEIRFKGQSAINRHKKIVWLDTFKYLHDRNITWWSGGYGLH